MLEHRPSRKAVVAPATIAAVALGVALSSGAACSGTRATTTSGTMMGTGGHGGTGGATTGSTTTTTSTGGAGGAGGAAPKPCAADADCTGSPGGPFCDTSTGACVACLPSNDTCAAGTYCDGASHTCAAGCKGNADCVGDTDGTVLCNPASHKCVQCLADGDCAAGQVCLATSNICIPGCTPTHDCPAGETCCGTSCHDLTSDLGHCGDCSKACASLANAVNQCANGMCQLKQCLPAFADCNGDMTDGCEWNVLEDGPCLCTPGDTRKCYQGAPGTQNVGPCIGGTQTCDESGTSWGACVGQVLPSSEICNNGVDDDCDGVVDNVPDIDGDGWTVCTGDCCEVAGQGCSNPSLVNPGAFEVAGDGVDNDCDGVVDDPVTTACSAAQKLTGVTGLDVAQAMDICKLTTASGGGPLKTWGLISATQTHADGSAVTNSQAQDQQTSVMTAFGTGGVVPTKNATLAVISNGRARAAESSYPKVPGTNFSSSIPFTPAPAPPLGTYLAAHNGGLLPGRCGTSACPVGTGANDSINIRLQIRVPTNAQGFSYDFRFFSAEYYNYQCTQFNDYYLALLTSNVAGLPADHNISFDALHNSVSVNNGFFQDCGGNSKACGPCPYGVGALAGTGFDAFNGGATEWLTTDAPVVPGEVITLDLMVFDVNDYSYDTLILLDNFRWSLSPVTLGTHT